MKELVVETEKLKHNLKTVREIIKKNNPQTKIIAVIKGNGYGLGLVEYAQFLEDNGINFFAVATVEEAVKLRQKGIKQDILMMSSTAVKEDVQALIENNIILTIGSKEAGEVVDELAQKMNQKARVHLKIDTGFGRYGFIYNQKEEMVKLIKSWKNIQIEGMFSHFSIAFYGNGQESKEQYDRFMNCVEELKHNGINPEILHVCNSSAFLRFHDMHLSAVRVGSVLLGRLSIPNQWGFKKVGYLTSNVAEIKVLPAGYEHFAGRPSNITSKLSDLSGFTSVKYAYLDGIRNATQRELELIRTLLMGGVVL